MPQPGTGQPNPQNIPSLLKSSSMMSAGHPVKTVKSRPELRGQGIPTSKVIFLNTQNAILIKIAFFNALNTKTKHQALVALQPCPHLDPTKQLREYAYIAAQPEKTAWEEKNHPNS